MKRISALFLILTLFSFMSIQAGEYYFTPPKDNWGLVAPHSGTVNPESRSSVEKFLSLRGTWDFCLDSSLMGRHRMGKGPDWREPDWPELRTIEVPGCWENQGVGTPGPSRTWDPVFDNCIRDLKNTYWGAARYRKKIVIPADWKECRIWLAVGGVRTEAWLWVNNKRVARVNNYCGTYKFDITDYVSPGKEATIVATVRNDSPSRKGQMTSFNKFGGFYRDLELSATPERFLDDLWVRGNLDDKSVEAHLRVGAVSEKICADYSAVKIVIKSLDGKTVASKKYDLPSGKDVTAVVTLSIPDLIPWTPEKPTLYRAEAELLDKSGAVCHGLVQRFGIKKFEVRGNRFYLNNKPYYLRGYGDDWIYPLTLVSPADRESHLKNFRIIKEAGFNYVRLHTHCELPEYFEAADEAGVLVQPELPYYHDITTEAFEFDPLRDLQELCTHYRRYVSFATYSLGNEGHLGSPLDVEIYRWVKSNDPDRLIQHQDGGCNITEGDRKNADFDTPNSYQGASSILPWTPGTFDYLTAPFVAHEYMNLGIKMDSRLEPKFTGGLPAPLKIADYEKRLAAVGLDRTWGDRCIRGAHALQGYYQKEGIEAARIDPACDGFSFWTLVDVMVPNAGTISGQGFLNAFYETKDGGLTPKEFSKFNAPTVLPITFDRNPEIYSSGEVMTVELCLSHFGSEPLQAGKIRWRLVETPCSPNDKSSVTKKTVGKNLIFASGEIPLKSIETGFVGLVGTAKVSIPEVTKPVRVDFSVEIDGTATGNSRSAWIFPSKKVMRASAKELPPIAASSDIFERIRNIFPQAKNLAALDLGMLDANSVILFGPSDNSVQLKQAIAQKRRILQLGGAEGGPNIRLGWWSLGSQLGTGFDSASPVFGDFPIGDTLDPVWFRIFKQGRDMKTPLEYGKLTPLAVGESVDSYQLYAGYAKIGGAKIVAVFGLDLLADLPEAENLLINFVRYAAKGDFSGAAEN